MSVFEKIVENAEAGRNPIPFPTAAVFEELVTEVNEHYHAKLNAETVVNSPAFRRFVDNARGIAKVMSIIGLSESETTLASMGAALTLGYGVRLLEEQMSQTAAPSSPNKAATPNTFGQSAGKISDPFEDFEDVLGDTYSDNPCGGSKK